MKQLDRSKSSTLQHQLYETLKEWFITDFSPEETLPTEVGIAKKFSVSRGTVRTALDQLVKEDLISRIPGKGSFLNSKFYIQLKTYRIGVILSEIDFFSNNIWEYNWFSQLEIINGIMRNSMDYNITADLISEKHFSPSDNERYDGFIIWPFVRKEVSEAITKPYVPLQFRIDMVQGFSLIARDMIDKGYKKPAFVGFSQGKRVKTLNETLEKGGHPLIEEELVYECGGSAKEGYRSAVELLAANEGIDCIVCSTDYRADGVLRYLDEMDIEVPGQIAVYGFEGTDRESLKGPSISTVSYDGTYPGLVAIKSIRALLDGRELPVYTLPHGKFVKKRSSL